MQISLKAREILHSKKRLALTLSIMASLYAIISTFEHDIAEESHISSLDIDRHNSHPQHEDDIVQEGHLSA